MFKVLVALFVIMGITYALPNPGILGLSAATAPALQLQPSVAIQAAVPIQAAYAGYAAAPLAAATSYSYQNQLSQRLQPAALAIQPLALAGHLG